MPHASGQITLLAVTNTAVLAAGHPIILSAVRVVQATEAATEIFTQIFNAAAATDVTLGTTIPDWVVQLDEAVGGVSVGDGLPEHGLSLSLGCVVACTDSPEGSANAGNTNTVHLGVY